MTPPAGQRVGKLLQRYAIINGVLVPADNGSLVLWDDHRRKVQWLLRLKSYVEKSAQDIYRSYLRVCTEKGWGE